LNKPILFLIFNRLDTTQKTFEQIRIAQPPKLYLASDGPRESKAGEKEAVELVRNWVLENIDWECEVKTLFRTENLSCKYAVSDALNWFFEQEPDGIVLEDDCVPSQSFFEYCEELLDHYKEDKRIWHVSGQNPLGVWDCKGASYYFAQDELCWGWATWADRWQAFDINMPDFEENMLNIKEVMPNLYTYSYWDDKFSKCKTNEINSWAYIWTYTIMKEHGLCINPHKNLVTNIGFEGVHFKDSERNTQLNCKRYNIDKIVHPKAIGLDYKARRQANKKYLKLNRLKDVMHYAKIHLLFPFKKDFWALLR